MNQTMTPSGRPCRHPPRGRSLSLRYRLGVILILLAPGSLSAFGFGTSTASRSIGPGDEVVLNQSIQVKSGARIYLQFGQVSTRAALQHREPFCYFFAYRDPSVIDTGLTIHPDRFTVTRVHRRIEYSQGRRDFVQYATTRLMDDSAENLMTRIQMTSKAQLHIRELKCGIFAVPLERNYLSLAEIQATLGDLVSLKLQGQSVPITIWPDANRIVSKQS